MPANDNAPPNERRPAAEGGDAASLALMITRRQRTRLLALGLSEADLHVMTPAEAHRLLRENGALPPLD